MANLTIKNVPGRVLRRLKARAALHRRSLNLEVIVCLESLVQSVGAEFSVASQEVLQLSMRSRCSAYDCEFVALALDLGVPFLTADRQVLRAFPSTAVSPADFVE